MTIIQLSLSLSLYVYIYRLSETLPFSSLQVLVARQYIGIIGRKA